MPEYKITWTINIDGKNPADAALEALKIMQDKESVATVFDVQDEQMKTMRVDLTIVGS